MKRIAARTLLIGSFLFATHALAQPERPTPRPQDEPLAGPSSVDGRSADEMRAALRARLIRINREKSAIEKALKDLDEGRDIDWPPTHPASADRMRRASERADEIGGSDRRGFRERFRERGNGPPDESRTAREPLTEAQRAEIVAFLKEHDPRMLARFDDISERNPEFAERLLKRFGHRTLRLIELEDEDPERFQSQLKSMQSRGRIREVMTDAIKDGVLESQETRETLRTLIATRLDTQEAEHEDEIDRLAKRISHLREERALARERAAERVEKMVDRMIRKAQEFRDSPKEGGPQE